MTKRPHLVMSWGYVFQLHLTVCIIQLWPDSVDDVREKAIDS
jgi:hypothetical protein